MRKEGVLGVVVGFETNLIRSDAARPLRERLNCILRRSLPMLHVAGLIGKRVSAGERKNFLR